MSGKQGLDCVEGGDTTPLPSAPPPCYEEAMASQASSQPYGTPCQPSSVPLMANESYVQARPPCVQPPAPKPYPVQQGAPLPTALPRVIVGGGLLPVGRRPLKTSCPQCHDSISTRTQVKNACRPTFWCIIMFLTVVCALCSCCPYLLCHKPLQVDHFCPRCNAFLGSYIDHS